MPLVLHTPAAGYTEAGLWLSERFGSDVHSGLPFLLGLTRFPPSCTLSHTRNMQFDWDPPPGAYPTDPLPSVDDSVIGTDSPAAQGVVERLLLFPTYARLSLTPQQAIHAAQIKKAVATIPSTPPVADTSTDPSTQPPVDNVNVPTNGPALFELKESIQTALIENVQSTGCPDNPGEEPDRAWLVNFKGKAYSFNVPPARYRSP